MTEEVDPLELRVLRIEGVLGLRPDLRFAGGSEWWIVQASGSRGERGLNYWGPYEKDAAQDALRDDHRVEHGCVLIEAPL